MIVMKFGGTSVADAKAIRQVADIVGSRLAFHPVVVVSAMAGVTDTLIRLCKEPDCRKTETARLVKRHLKTARELGLDETTVAAELTELEQTVFRCGQRRKLSPAETDLILSFGERLSARLVAGYLTQTVVPAKPVMSYEAGLVTDTNFGCAEPLPVSRINLRRSLSRLKDLPVITGFLGRTPDGHLTTLGRGGSDFTAAYVGAALGARRVEIWTDVDGIMTADPRVVPGARTVSRLSFAEAAELAYFGAKVLHPKTLLPAIEMDIPVWVLNTFRPAGIGTIVTRSSRKSAEVVKAIACKRNIHVLNVVSTRMLMAHGFLARLFQVFADLEIVVDLLATSEVSVSLTVDCPDRLREAARRLARLAEVRLEQNRALVCVVGDGIGKTPGLAGAVFSILGKAGINVEMISQGASRTNLSFVVDNRYSRRCVRLLHDYFFGNK